jgi:hypothetical protein
MEARYANHIEIGANNLEFILLLGQKPIQEGGPPLIHTSLVVAPAFAREICRLLMSSLENFEREHGPIPSGATVQPLQNP